MKVKYLQGSTVKDTINIFFHTLNLNALITVKLQFSLSKILGDFISVYCVYSITQNNYPFSLFSLFHFIKVKKVNIKFFLVHALKAYRES